MRRIATLATVVVLVLVAAVQIALPPLAERRAQHRLTASGGSADVDLDALPAVRLLFDEGDRARVRARGIELPLAAPGGRVLSQLDGFDDVDVAVTDARAGPFRLSSVTLERSGGDSPYRTTIKGSVTARDLASFGAGQLGGGFGAFLGGLMGGALPFGDQPVAIDLDAVLRSDGGEPHAVTVHGTVAGVPAGALAEVLAAALAGRF
jgi:hypothetical protein